VVQLDIRNSDEIQRLFDREKPQTIFHLAAHGVGRSSQQHDESFETNVMATARLARIALSCNVERFVQVGTAYEYRSVDTPIDEAAPLEPTNLYSASKLAAWVLLDYLRRTENLPLITVRPFLTYGPGDNPAKLVPYVIAKCLVHDKFTVNSGDLVRDFLFVGDLIRAIRTCSHRDAEVGQVFNIGGGKSNAVELRMLVEHICRITGAPMSLCEFGPAMRSSLEPAYLVANSSKANDRLHWRPEVSLLEGLQRTIEWHRMNPQANLDAAS
jgi:nucleoside-diphosphate-sugar epimerase